MSEPDVIDLEGESLEVVELGHDDMTVSEFVGIAEGPHINETVEGDIFEVEDPENLPMQKADWVPYQGPRGGEGWQNVESGEVVYDETPPGETDIDPDEYYDAGIDELLDAIEAVTGEDMSEEWEDFTADGVRQAIQVMASPGQLGEVMEELSEGLGYDGEYDVDTEFESEVAEAVEEGEVASRITTSQWNTTSDIDNEELLLDALKQIEENGTKTAKSRVRSRLRGLGWEPDDIDAELREQSLEWTEKFEEGDSFFIEFPGGEETVATVLNVSEDEDEWWDIKVRYEDGNAQVLEAADLEAAEIRSDDLDLEERFDSVVVSEPGKSDGVPNEVYDLWEDATTQDLQEYIQSEESFDAEEVENPLGELFDFVPDDAEDAESDAEVDALEVVEAFDEGQINSDEAHQRARSVMEEYSEEFSDEVETPSVKLAKAMLWYRDDGGIEDIEEVITEEIGSQTFEGDVSDGYKNDVKWGLSDALNKVSAEIGSYAIAALDTVKYEDARDESWTGQHSDSGTIRMDVTESEGVRQTAAHEMGHQIHKSLGLQKRFGSYPSSEEWREFDRDDAMFGIPESDSEMYEDLEKLQKNWEEYRDGGAREIRPYQRRHGVEYLAVTFAKWATDEAKLEGRDPKMKFFWDKHVGSEETETVTEVSNIEEGDEIILEGQSWPEVFEVLETGGYGGGGTPNPWVLRTPGGFGREEEVHPDAIEEQFEEGLRYE